MIHFFKTCYIACIKDKIRFKFHMSENTKKRSELRFEREAKALQKNLEKRKKQQEALNKAQTEKEKNNGQTKD